MSRDICIVGAELTTVTTAPDKGMHETQPQSVHCHWQSHVGLDLALE